MMIIEEDKLMRVVYHYMKKIELYNSLGNDKTFTEMTCNFSELKLSLWTEIIAIKNTLNTLGIHIEVPETHLK